MKKILSSTLTYNKNDQLFLKSPKKRETCKRNRTLNDIMVTENEKRKRQNYIYSQSFQGKTNILHRILGMELIRGIVVIIIRSLIN